MTRRTSIEGDVTLIPANAKFSRRRGRTGAFVAALGMLIVGSYWSVTAVAAPHGSSGRARLHVVGIPAAQAMGVFRTPSVSTPPVSIAAQESLVTFTANHLGVSPTLLPGEADLHSAVTALSGLGSRAWSVTVAPTAKGEACDIVTSSSGTVAGGGCADTLSDANPVSYSIVSVGDTPTDQQKFIAGIASDDVASIYITVDGSRNIAALKHNAFFLQLPQASAKITSLEVTLTSGAEVSVAVPTVALPRK